jgi:hypothetical protein
MIAKAKVSASTPTSRGRDKRQTLRYTLCSAAFDTQALMSRYLLSLYLFARVNLRVDDALVLFKYQFITQ